MRLRRRPVIAFRRGGALETVAEGRTGLFFDEQTIESLNGAIERFDTVTLDTQAIRAHAHTFNCDRFKREMSRVIEQALLANASAGGTADVRQDQPSDDVRVARYRPSAPLMQAGGSR